MTRAERRKMRATAKEEAEALARAGFFDVVGRTGRLGRVTHPPSIRALKREIAAMLAAGCEPRCVPLTHDEAHGLAGGNPPDGLDGWRFWLALAVDRDGRVSWVGQWVAAWVPAQHARDIARAATRGRLMDWCETSGWGLGDMAPMGAA